MAHEWAGQDKQSVRECGPGPTYAGCPARASRRSCRAGQLPGTTVVCMCRRLVFVCALTKTPVAVRQADPSRKDGLCCVLIVSGRAARATACPPDLGMQCRAQAPDPGAVRSYSLPAASLAARLVQSVVNQTTRET